MDSERIVKISTDNKPPGRRSPEPLKEDVATLSLIKTSGIAYKQNRTRGRKAIAYHLTIEARTT